MPERGNYWKRRERALSAGAICWSLSIGAIVSIYPNKVANWLLSTGAYEVAGTIMLSIGLCAGFCDTLLIGLERWATGDIKELTEVPWE